MRSCRIVRWGYNQIGLIPKATEYISRPCIKRPPPRCRFVFFRLSSSDEKGRKKTKKDEKGRKKTKICFFPSQVLFSAENNFKKFSKGWSDHCRFTLLPGACLSHNLDNLDFFNLCTEALCKYTSTWSGTCTYTHTHTHTSTHACTHARTHARTQK